jgi:hypothetical protein
MLIEIARKLKIEPLNCSLEKFFSPINKIHRYPKNKALPVTQVSNSWCFIVSDNIWWKYGFVITRILINGCLGDPCDNISKIFEWFLKKNGVKLSTGLDLFMWIKWWTLGTHRKKGGIFGRLDGGLSWC